MTSTTVTDVVTSPVDDQSPPLAAAAGKLRLMCSYGGQIIPRPRTKSLFYAGGDTRIVAIPYKVVTSLSSLTNYLAVALGVDYPFTVKYQLPHHDLDSLVSVATDEDVQMMVEENGRLSGASRPRIRLFLFPPKSQPCRLGHTQSDPIQKEAVETDWFGMAEKELTQHEKTETDLFVTAETNTAGGELARPVLQHPKTETWFVDALRSARIMQSERNNGGVGGGDGGSGGGLCGQESIVLETNSSFGSTSSSVSLSNLPPVKSNGEDNMARLMDNKVKFASPESVTSENSVATPISHVQTRSSHELATHIPVFENKVSSNPSETESSLLDPSFTPLMHKQVLVSGYPPFPLVDQPPQQQVQFIYPGTHCVIQNPPGVIPITSCYPMYQHPQPQPPTQAHFQPQPPTQVHFQPQQSAQIHFQPQQPIQVHFQPQQPYAIYYVPVGQTQQPYDLPMQAGLMSTSGVSSTEPPMTQDVSLCTHQPDSKEVRASPLMPKSASQVYPTAQAANPLIDVSFDTQQQIQNQPQAAVMAHREIGNHNNDLEDDAARAQIYKSQPPPPMVPSQYQAVMLSEAFTQLRSDKS